MKVSEIFESIEGEGIRVGMPVTFIRLFGCNLRCSYCDSLYACEGNDYTEMAIEDILEKVKQLGNKCITLTGGEPLIHKDVRFLIAALSGDNYKINIETNGATDIVPFIRKNVIFTIDYKCPSSKMESTMLSSNFCALRDKDVVKFVVGDENDLKVAHDVIKAYRLDDRVNNIFISPVFGQIDPKKIVEFVLNEKWCTNIRVQLQIHKIIWDADKRGV